MIVDERREGGLQPVLEGQDQALPVWRQLDRSTPLGMKLAIPVIAVTLAGTALFGDLLVEQTKKATDAEYIATANAAASGAATTFYNSTISQATDVTPYLADLVSSSTSIEGAWIVNVVERGAPVMVSSRTVDVGRTGLLDDSDINAVLSGTTVDRQESINGESVLLTVVPVKGNTYAAVILTSLKGETQIISQTVAWVVFAGVVASCLEIATITLILEAGVVRRIRRVQRAIGAFGRGSGGHHLPEGSEPPGRDVLFNLARQLDHKLSELGELERASDVMSQLGSLALQGSPQSDLTTKALELTRRALELDGCLLVEARGAGSASEASGSQGVHSPVTELPVWVGALVRAAAQARRVVLADSLGERSRYWELNDSDSSAAAVFVPLAGASDRTGVMVGLARPGAPLTAAGVSLMESVATTLGESVQRDEAQKARRESDVKSAALATVSYEMRDPLNAVLGFTDLLQKGAAGPLNDKQQEWLRRVDDASHQMLRLVDDYLDMAKVIAGSLPMQMDAVVVADEVKAVLGLLAPAAAAKKVDLRSSASPGAVAHADRTRLRQVLTNLVSNAIAYTPARGHVRVEASGGDNGVRISVIDTGVGIPADRQHLVFTEFAQLRADEAGGGAGLGLALSKRFVDAMGGFIRFTSSEGAGTIFDVWLPGEATPKPDGNESVSIT